ncbi:MAG TPA: response regulator transcription factor [Ilumatobacteraceae bacterium]|nr:response regulator transcription factor [Ilumatobacteraceae bacterium]
MITVVLGEDHALLRAGLATLLGDADDIDLLGVGEDLPSLTALIDEHDPDVVVTDIRMPPTGTDEGITLAARLRRERPTTGVVVLSQHDDPAYALALLDGGSEGRAYLLKERVGQVGELLHAVREVAGGGSVIDPKIVEGLVAASRRTTPSDLDRLTPREREVLAEMATGKSNAAIAATLVLSERAIEKHTNSIFSKLGLTEEPDVNRRVKAVLVHLAG